MSWHPYDSRNPPKPGTRIKSKPGNEAIAQEGSMICDGTADPSYWSVWVDGEKLPDTVRPAKPKSDECKCGIWRQRCDYHRD